MKSGRAVRRGGASLASVVVEGWHGACLVLAHSRQSEVCNWRYQPLSGPLTAILLSRSLSWAVREVTAGLSDGALWAPTLPREALRDSTCTDRHMYTHTDMASYMFFDAHVRLHEWLSKTPGGPCQPCADTMEPALNL